MTNTHLLQAIGRIDPGLIADAAPDVPQRKHAFRIRPAWGIAAACVCFTVAVCAFLLSVAFSPSRMDDVFRDGVSYPVERFSGLPAAYDGRLLAPNLALSEDARIEFYYREGGDPTHTEDWYSLIVADTQKDRDLLLHCLFGGGAAEDWKVHMVFTEEATKRVCINGVEVQIAPNATSLGYKYWYYALFEYDGAVYDLRVKSDDPNAIFDVLQQLLKE